MQDKKLVSYEEKKLVDIDCIDANKNIFLQQIMKFFEQIADKHSSLLGVNNPVIIEKNNLCWVITKLKIEVDSVPKLYDEIDVKTIIHKPSLIKFDRDFVISKNGAVMVNGYSEWCLLDVDTRKVAKADKISYPLDGYSEKPQRMYSNFVYENMALLNSYEYTVKFCDLDLNFHLNNTQYAIIVQNLFDPDFWSKKDIKSFEIKFLNESVYNDKIMVKNFKVEDDKFYIEAYNTTKDKLSFKAEIIFCDKEG